MSDHRHHGQHAATYPVSGTSALQPYVPVLDRRKRRVEAKKREERISRLLSFTWKSVLIITVASIAFAYMCIAYLQMKEKVLCQTKENERLEATLAGLKSENDALAEEYRCRIDLDEVRRIALEEWGLHYPRQDQIIWYSNDEAYIRQFREVPR